MLKNLLEKNGILIRLFEDRGEIIARIAISLKSEMEKTVQIIEAFVKGTEE